MSGTFMMGQAPPSAYERLLGWTSVAPVLLLIVLLVELELLRAHDGRGLTKAASTMMVLIGPLSILVAAIGLVRAAKLVT